MKKILIVISWVFTVFFIMLALGGFPSLSSVFCFLSAILLLPVERWQTLLKKFLKNAIRIITVVVAFVLAICFFPSTDIPKENNSKDDHSTSTTMSITSTTTIVSTTTTSTTNTSTTGKFITTTSIPTTAAISTTDRFITTTSRPTTGKQGISILQEPNTVNPNELTTVSIKGAPNTKYTISVYYSSGASKADGLEDKTSDSNGNVSWTWKVGGKTKAGTYRIVIKGGGQETTLYFTVT